MNSDDEKRVTAIVQLALKLGPTRIDEDAIHAALGNAAGDSTAQVGRIFERSHATISHTWRPNGMPGSKQHYPIAPILIWVLNRDLVNEAARGVDEFTSRKREAETRSAEAIMRIQEMRAERLDGEVMSVVLMKSQITMAFGIIRDQIMSLGRSCQPFLPRAHAVELREKIDRQAERVLKQAADLVLAAFSDNQSNGEQQTFGD
jgi:hypothetical protein